MNDIIEKNRAYQREWKKMWRIKYPQGTSFGDKRCRCCEVLLISEGIFGAKSHNTANNYCFLCKENGDARRHKHKLEMRKIRWKKKQ